MVQQPNLRITEEKDCRLSSDKSDQGKQSAKALCLELTVIWSLRQHETFILGSLISSDQALAVWGLQQATTADCTRSAGSCWILQIQGFKNAICSLCSGLSGITLSQCPDPQPENQQAAGDCSVVQCIPLRQSKTDKTDKNLSFSSSTSAPAMQGGSYQSNAIRITKILLLTSWSHR